MENIRQIADRVDILNETVTQINALYDVLKGIEADAITSMEITLQWKGNKIEHCFYPKRIPLIPPIDLSDETNFSNETNSTVMELCKSLISSYNKFYNKKLQELREAVKEE